MKKLFLLATSVAMTLAMTTRAEAAVEFDPTGSSSAGVCSASCVLITTLDPTVGNSLSSFNAATDPAGTVGDVYFQANLGIATNGGSQVFANGDGGDYFTIAASFEEVLGAKVPLPGGDTLLLFEPPALDGSLNGTFRIYAQTGEGSDLNGFCFVESCGGTLILEGGLINNVEAGGGFITNFATGFEDLDQSGDNNYPGVSTISGNGSFSTQIFVNFVDRAYFPFLPLGSLLEFTIIEATTQQSLPFLTADPSACFSSDAVTSCNAVGVGSVGTTNGLNGDNTILQTDASLSFITSSEIPEPATMTMLGLGLLGVVAARKFRSRKS